MSYRSLTAILPRVILFFGILLAVSMLAIPLYKYNPLFAQDGGTIEYAENGTVPVATYTAADPEGTAIVSWMLGGDDASDFTIDDGVLRFKESPDYEMPVSDDMDNTYEVIVQARDSTRQTGMKAVMVMVTDVDEDGMVMLSALQPSPSVAFDAMLTDIDNRDDDLTGAAAWQWSRSMSMSSGWVDISGAAAKMSGYTPVDGDQGYYLRAVAMYTDNHSPGGADNDKMAYAVSSEMVVGPRSSNEAPSFSDADEDDDSSNGNQADREVSETAEAGTRVGNPLVAMDDDSQDVLTYTLADDDDIPDNPRKFVIDRETGQISVAKGAKFNREGEPTVTGVIGANSYTVTVIATDPTAVPTDDATSLVATATDTIEVMIAVNAVDEAPVFTTGDPAVSFLENGTITNMLGAAYAGNDPEESGDLDLGIRGADRSKFDFDTSNGNLTFKASPDYEMPGDANKDNVYEVTITATDMENNVGTMDVKVTVENANEDGMVTLSETQPRVGFAITADLEDADGGATGESWQWWRSTNNDPASEDIIPPDLATPLDSQWEMIEGAMSATYTPVEDDDVDESDVGRYLVAVVTYTDAHEPMDNTDTQDVDESEAKDLARMRTANPVEKDTRNKAPVFRNDDGEMIASTTREVAENTDGAVGSPVMATDPDPNEDPLTYTLSGLDMDKFEVGDMGRIMVGAGTELDYEMTTTYLVTVMARDSFGATASIDVTITVTDMDEGPNVSGDASVDYSESDMGPVATYTAADPEGTAIVSWMLGGDDASDFTIDDGVLRFKESPDYEMPVSDDMDNTYEVIVQARDSTRQTGMKAVMVMVTDVDEDGMVMLSALQPSPSVAFDAMLTDIDNRDDDLTGAAAWQWSRSMSMSSGWVDISGAAAKMSGYTPVDGDQGYYLRAVAMYTDNHSPGGADNDKMAYAVSSEMVVGPRSSNEAPSFSDADEDDDSSNGNQADREVSETAEAGTRVGNPLVAMDDDSQDVLTYTLADDDDIPDNPRKFVIDRETGQISVAKGAKFNREGEPTVTGVIGANSYTVTVIATDPTAVPTDDATSLVATATDTIEVMIAVNAVDEAPVFTTGDPAVSFLENGTITNMLGAAYAGNDPEESGDLDLGIRGADRSKFDFDTSNGNLTFKASPDYEMPGDANKDNVYEVTITATDMENNVGTMDVKVTVENANEDGMVTLSETQPRVGFAITADLEDADGGATGESWQWWRSTNNDPASEDIIPPDLATPLDSQWEMIEGAMSATYTPVEDDDVDESDVGRYLVAVVTYTDAHEPMDNTDTQDVDESEAKDLARMRTANPVEKDTRNKAPVFRNDDGEMIASTTREVAENTDGAVGSPVMATDPDPNEDPLTYTLSGLDMDKFEVGDMGRIMVGAGTELDYEMTTTYLVTVMARDSFGATASIDVTITVTDMDEAPEIMLGGLAISGMSSVDYPENGMDAVATYMATGPDADMATWTLSGGDMRAFSLSNDGMLTFRSSPDYENPTDMGMDNMYMVTITADDGTYIDTHDVMVMVTNVNEAGTLNLSTMRPAVDTAITATLSDLDSMVSGEMWQWASSDAMDGTFDPITGATSSSYTPVAADNGMFLRATVSYTDGHGPGKTEMATTENMVTMNASPMFHPETGTREVAENTAAGMDIGDPVTATDADDDMLTYTLGGTNAASFDIDSSTGQLMAKAALDYETKDSYEVTVTATDPDSASDMIIVTVTVTNVEEPGMVTLWAGTDALTMAPQVGDTITGAVMDPDGGVTGETWQWAKTRTPDMMASWMDIAGETNTAYMVTAGDTGHYLRVMATYMEAVGTDMVMVYSMPTMMVGAEAEDTLLNRYDANDNDEIELDEVFKAIDDYFDYDDRLTLEEIYEIVDLYFES